MSMTFILLEYCGPDEFRCSRARNECIPLTKVCDFKTDCLYKEDEQLCDFKTLNDLCSQGLTSPSPNISLQHNMKDSIETDVNALDTRLNPCYNGQLCSGGFSNTCYLSCPTGCSCFGLSFICTSNIAPVFATSVTLMGLKQEKLEFSTYNYDKIYRNLIELKIIDCELQNLIIVGLVPIQILTISNSTIEEVYIEDANNYLQYLNIVNSDFGELKFDLLHGFKILGFEFYVHKSLLRKIVSTQYPKLTGVHVHMSKAIGFPYMVHRFFNKVVNLSFCDMLDPPYSRQNIITLDLSHNLLKTWEISPFVRILHLQHNLIETVNFTGDLWHSQARLMYLDLSYNIIEKINKKDLDELPNLLYLKIQNNRLVHVHESAFKTVSKLLHLDLSSNYLRYLKRSHFIYLSNLQYLYLKNNNIKVVEGMFDGLINIQLLQVDSFTFCCAQPKAVNKINCSAPINEISSCYNLIDTPLLTIIIWYIAILAVFGNLLGLIYRFLVLKEKTISPFVIYSINLGIADFLMGVYLYIIAGANLVFSGRYGFEDDFWRHSPLCVFAGVAATLSSEASALFVLSITIDRILIIRFPFSGLRNNHWVPKIVSSFVWILSLLLALLPLTESEYFSDYYSSSGICITLPLSTVRKSGWEYSMSIFVGANFLIFIAILLGQIVIFVDVVRMGKEVSSQRNMQRRRETNLAKTLIAVAMTDMFCWIPIGVIGLLTFMGIDVTPKVYAWVVVVVLPINSALNPIIYTFSAILRRRGQQVRLK
ncbi:G-protein coupled receptor GRL101-like [Saccostrea echinata]|uniref:G-protein coupled receptor GRL101-like n=1 Tax=Saccostrea echinata TaxID=191078 RepID=UPI002A841287|nr:G-protein coupled receptor GRL101-like [Saccostrea echinata]